MYEKLSARFLTVAVLAAFAQAGHLGYDYYPPNHNLLPPPQQQPNYYNYYNSGYSPNYQGNSVSYSISHGDYNFLREYKNHQHINSNANNVGYNYPQPVVHQQQSNTLSNSQILSSSSSSIQTQGVNVQSQGVNVQSQGVNFQSQGVNFQSQVTPKITKHIYFHIPPTDIEEKPVPVIPAAPKKKTYNIIFIKLPSQQARNAAQIQNLLQNQLAAANSKTLIYVLSKNPESQTVTAPPVKSEHEVFYVKYKDDKSLQQISEAPKSLKQVEDRGQLLPGLVNGQV